MGELRWHPLIRDWVMIASHRQTRPQAQQSSCPFCPGAGRVPEEFDVFAFQNDFPALSPNPPPPDPVATDFFRTAPAYGRCEVLLYSPEHSVTLPDLSDEHVTKLVALWCERFEAMGRDEKIRYCLIFENRGAAAGATIQHPHGQIYGYPFLPKKLQEEVAAAEDHHRKTGRCLFCDLLANERKEKARVIFSNEHFTVFLPFFTEWPYGVYIQPNRHVSVITELTPSERFSLAVTLRRTVGMLDALFGYPFPYMMCLHSAPFGEGYAETYHFHIEFFPPMRSAEQIKFCASSETGAWAQCNPTCPEEKAAELRAALGRFLSASGGQAAD